MASAVAAVGADSAVVTHVGSLDSEVGAWPDDFLPIGQQITFERLNAADPGRSPPTPGSDAASHCGSRISSASERTGTCGSTASCSVSSRSTARWRSPSRSASDERLSIALDRNGRDFSAAELDCLAALARPSHRHDSPRRTFGPARIRPLPSPRPTQSRVRCAVAGGRWSRQRPDRSSARYQHPDGQQASGARLRQDRRDQSHPGHCSLVPSTAAGRLIAPKQPLDMASCHGLYPRLRGFTYCRTRRGRIGTY